MLENTSPELVHSAARAHVPRVFCGTMVGALGLTALYLVVRRMDGALVAPLDFLPALAIGLLLAFGTWSLRRLAVAVAPDDPRLEIGITLITWLLVAVVTLAGTSPLAILALWLPLIATEATWRLVPAELGRRAGEPASRPDEARQLVGPPPQLLQQLIRTRGNGRENVAGTARIDFDAGEQTAAQHVVFCPPLEGDPEVEVEAPDAEGVTVRATERRSYGLRLEARRGDTAAAQTVLVRFAATSASS